MQFSSFRNQISLLFLEFFQLDFDEIFYSFMS